MASEYLETIRTPLAKARAHVAAADANLTGIVTALAAGDAVSWETIKKALVRQAHAQQDLRRSIYAALGVQAVHGRALNTSDTSDLALALLTALRRIEGKPAYAGINTGTPECWSSVA